MKIFGKVLVVIFLLFCAIQSISQTTERSRDTNSNIVHLADPTIFFHKKTYYLYGTVEGASGNGFIAFISRDLKTWKRSSNNDGYVLKKGESFGTSGFWAPQVFLYKGFFYMAYVANEQIAIATSTTPLGPFTQVKMKSLEAPVKQIDPFLFIDDDGKKYLYHVRLVGGNKIFVAEMTDDFSSIKPETLKECVVAKEAWENTANAPWPVAEGPSVLKHKGVYYLFYTANDFRNPNYATGYATSNNPLGPWKKWEGNPILNKELVGANGTGHGDFITKGDKLLYVFHTHNSNSKVAPRKTAIAEMQWKRKNKSEMVQVRENSFRYLLAE